MSRPLSNDIRERIVRSVESGLSRNATAKRFDVSISAVVKLMQWKATGSFETKKIGGYRKDILAKHEDRVGRLLESKPDMTIAEMHRRLAADRIKVGTSSIARFLAHLGYSYKKTVHASEQDRPDVKAARIAWRASQPGLDPARLVFIDETGATTNMARRYGRSLIGHRLLCKEPWGHWKTTTFTAALRSTGLTAPLMLNGPMDGEAFLTYIAKALVPTLKPGDIVVMNNLPSHKVAGIEEAILAAGANLHYLPPYSPDLNPIEQAFAKIKALLRKAAARSHEQLWRVISKIISAFTPIKCAAYLKNSRYSA